MKISKIPVGILLLIGVILLAVFINLFPPFIQGTVEGHPTVAIRLDIPWLGLLVIAAVVFLAALGMHWNGIAQSKIED